MISVGEKLRRERVRQGVDLAQLARDTRINRKYLEAIEADDSSQIPGGFFYRSFVRQYALALGMNAQELDNELQRAREAEAPVLSAALQTAAFPLKQIDPIVRATNQRVAAGRLGAYVLLLVGVMAGCSAFYTWWHRMEVQQETAAREGPATTKPVAARSAVATQQPAPGARPPQVSVDISQAGPDDRVVLSVAAHEATWLSITSDGKSVFSGILEPTQTKVLGGKDRAFLRVGNAGGLEIIWNGKSIGPIGERGQVKTIVFTPESFQIRPAAGGSL